MSQATLIAEAPPPMSLEKAEELQTKAVEAHRAIESIQLEMLEVTGGETARDFFPAEQVIFDAATKARDAVSVVETTLVKYIEAKVKKAKADAALQKLADEANPLKQAQLAFDSALAKFLDHCREVHKLYLEKAKLTSLKAPAFYVEKGRRYMRVVRDDGGSSRSVHCFIDMTNGDVLKAASWKAPAKHARGNIFGEYQMGPHGAPYMK